MMTASLSTTPLTVKKMINKNIEIAEQIAAEVQSLGGKVYYVGGAVRDKLLNIENDDIDIEVHGITPELLDNILEKLGKKREIGASFGIWGLDGADIDIAMPRTECATGRGHRDFKTYTDPFIGEEKAAKRRDFTVNAIMENVLTHEIVDMCGGVGDIKKKILRHVSDDSFAEDPLRVLRAAGFAARFGFEVAEETKALCKTMSLDTLSRERILSEIEKALIKADKPSVFFEFLREIGKLDTWFPELQALIGVKQNPEFHFEGDVWSHTMLTLDKAAKLREKAEQPFYFMLSALVHDFGKAITTEEINGKIHSYRHESEGLALVKDFTLRLTDNKKLKTYLLNMTELHMRPNMAAHQAANQKSMNKLFDLSCAPNDLLILAEADYHASLHKSGNPPYDKMRDFLNKALNKYNEVMEKPYVSGADLIAAGIKPGPSFSELLSLAHKLRLADVPKEQALKQVINEAKKGTA